MNVAKAHILVALVLPGTLCASVQASEIAIEKAPTIEVFTDSSLQIVSGNDHTTVYVIDRINRFQQVLSKDLPTDPEAAKKTVLQRFQRMDRQLSGGLENAANGLLKATQYGIDRYPAIVFDGRAVVYGITDIQTAIQRYRQWQAGEPRS